ncbi:MAG: biotin/lipoyl-containing protein, partial [Myxococcota bacterium]
LVSALTDFELVVRGGATNKGLLIDLLETAEYRSGAVDTGWLDESPGLRSGTRAYAVEALVTAAILAYQRARDVARRGFFADPSDLSAASVPASGGQRIDLSRGGDSYRLEIFAVGAWRYRVHLDGRVVTATLRGEGAHRARLETGGRSLRVLYDVSERGLRVEIEGRPYRFDSELAGQVRAGTPALVIALHVEAGARVEAGQTLGLLEAMKMEIGFQAPVDGVVKEICVNRGQQVSAGELLLRIDPAGGIGEVVWGGERLALPAEPDPLDIFFALDEDGARTVPDLKATEASPAEARRGAIAAARDEIRRVVMGYDVDPERGEKLAAFLEAPLPSGLEVDFRWELAEIRHELTLFTDVNRLFNRAPRASVSGEPGPSIHAQLRRYVRHLPAAGAGLSDEFLELLKAGLRHYGVTELRHDDALERAVLRLFASQLAPELRRRLAMGMIRRIHALVGSGIHLGDDKRLSESLSLTAGLRGLVPDALADLAIEAGYMIFEGPELESEAQRTTKEVEAWLAAAESAPTQPSAEVLIHLAASPRSVFDRVGRWLVDDDPRRRAIAIATHVSRFYAPISPAAHTSTVVNDVHVERLDLLDGRTVLGSVVRREAVGADLDRLGRAARAAAKSRGRSRIDAIELLVPAETGLDEGALRDVLTPEIAQKLSADRITVTLLRNSGRSSHRCFLCRDGRVVEQDGLHGLHPEVAARVDLDRLRAFELERLEAPDGIYCFHLRSAEVPADERIIVLADVRGRSPDGGYEANLHVPAFEWAYFEATRTLRNHLGLRDPRRRLHWNRIALFVGPSIYLDDELVQRLVRRLAPATRHLGLEKVVVRLQVLDRDAPERAAQPTEIVIADPTGSRTDLTRRPLHRDPLHPARDYERKVVEARRRRMVYPYEIVRMLTGAAGEIEVGREASA